MRLISWTHPRGSGTVMVPKNYGKVSYFHGNFCIRAVANFHNIDIVVRAMIFYIAAAISRRKFVEFVAEVTVVAEEAAEVSCMSYLVSVVFRITVEAAESR
jgi:hypothetical protein